MSSKAWHKRDLLSCLCGVLLGDEEYLRRDATGEFNPDGPDADRRDAAREDLLDEFM